MKKILLTSVMMFPVAIWAQEIKMDVKAGLWENTTVTEISGLQMPANMPQMTPEQMAQMPPAARARVEAMMKGGAGAPRTSTNKACVTAEQLSRPLLDNGDKSCTYKLTGSSSSSQNIHVECVKGNTNTSGDVALNRIDSEHVKGEVLMKTSGDSSTKGSIGQNMTIKLSFSNKWLGADCGNVQPSSNK
jgi:Protein of unknown function (DUF3617)